MIQTDLWRSSIADRPVEKLYDTDRPVEKLYDTDRPVEKLYSRQTCREAL
jgi:hypothetical protein